MLLHACEKRLSQVMQLMVAKPSSGRTPRGWPTAARVITHEAPQQGGTERGPQEAGGHAEDTGGAESALFEALWQYTQDRDALATLVEVCSCLHSCGSPSRQAQPLSVHRLFVSLSRVSLSSVQSPDP